MAKKRINKLEDVSIATLHTEIQRENRMKRCNRTFKNWNNHKRCSMRIMGLPEGEEWGRSHGNI